jgi:hypothetical protein
MKSRFLIFNLTDNILNFAKINFTVNGNFRTNLPIVIALLVLGSAPFLISLNEQETANQSSALALYLLVLGILAKITHHLFWNRHG